MRLPLVAVCVVAVGLTAAPLTAQSARAVDAIVDDLRDQESVSPPRVAATLLIEDDRRYQEHQVGLEGLAGSLSDELVEEGDITAPPLRATVGYFGLYQTFSGGWGLRAIVSIENAELSFARQVTFDEYTGDRVDEDDAERRLLEGLREGAESALSDFGRLAGMGVRVVRAVGVSATGSEEEAVRIARVRALARASGVDVTATTIVQDFGVAQDILSTEVRGRILSERMVEQHPAAGGEYVVLVEFLIKEENE